MNPIKELLRKQPLCILDGAFATELERRGHNLNDPLWSAKVLLENPDEVKEVHRLYFEAGADCVISASYQASFEGLQKRGFDEREAVDLISSSITLAKEARDKFWSTCQEKKKRASPLVAASVGPYGAWLADGSEYRGDYGLDEQELQQFHRKRLQTLIAAGPDILACETIPCLAEAKALAGLLKESPGVYAWISFSARDGGHTWNGERLEQCARVLDVFEQVAAIGINCTAPQYIDSLIDEIRGGTDKPVVVYPNSGEIYDTRTRSWKSDCPPVSISDLARGWYRRGARLIGGCCRTTPGDIRSIVHWSRGLKNPR